jgi:hypothetical protein
VFDREGLLRHDVQHVIVVIAVGEEAKAAIIRGEMLKATDELGNGGFPVRELIELVEYQGCSILFT